MKNLKKILLCFALVLVSLLTTFTIPQSIAVASISIDYLSKYTNVLEDLQSDSNFDAEDYPAVADDYSLQVINIAESSDNELFVYVYQPSEDTKNIVASTINISKTIGDDISYINYPLTLISNDGVFYKYKVENISIDTNINPRYYDITSIYRNFDSSIDESIEDENGNIINQVYYKVAKEYGVYTNSNGKTLYSCSDIETIEITEKYVGLIRYTDGWNGFFAEEYCDSHFVAFDTDKPIDKLMEADVVYTRQNYFFQLDVTGIGPTIGPEFSEPVQEYKTLTSEDEVIYEGNGFFAITYNWNRIQSMNEFVEDTNDKNIYPMGAINVVRGTPLTEEAKADLKKHKWVLRFAETNYMDSVTMAGSVTSYDQITEVSVLRLKFETDGIVYNLGVIDNFQSGDGKPDNYNTTNIEVSDWFKIVIAILLLIVLIVVLAPFLPSIISFVIWLFQILFNILMWILSLPIKIFKILFNKK